MPPRSQRSNDHQRRASGARRPRTDPESNPSGCRPACRAAAAAPMGTGLARSSTRSASCRSRARSAQASSSSRPRPRRAFPTCSHASRCVARLTCVCDCVNGQGHLVMVADEEIPVVACAIPTHPLHHHVTCRAGHDVPAAADVRDAHVEVRLQGRGAQSGPWVGGSISDRSTKVLINQSSPSTPPRLSPPTAVLVAQDRIDRAEGVRRGHPHAPDVPPAQGKKRASPLRASVGRLLIDPTPPPRSRVRKRRTWCACSRTPARPGSATSWPCAGTRPSGRTSGSPPPAVSPTPWSWCGSSG